MKPHDLNYKAIFTHPEIIQQLLKSFVQEEWINELDFFTLEKTNNSYVTDDCRARFDDLIWKVHWQDQDLYVYLLLEFQSEPEYFMSVRLMTYIGLLIRLKNQQSFLLIMPQFIQVMNLMRILKNGKKKV